MRIENIFYPNYYYEKNYKNEIFYKKGNNFKWNVVDVFSDGSCFALYSFNGDVKDLSGKYNGIWEDGSSYVYGLDGRKAARLTGDISINLGTDPILRELGTYDANFSISFWIQFFDGRYIISSGSQTISQGYNILNEASDKKYYFNVQTENYGTCTHGIDSGVVGENTWNFITLTYNNDTKTSKFYYNGILRKSYINPQKNCFNYHQELTIGRPNNGKSFYGRFNIQQLRLFKKELSEKEINLLFKNRC